MAKRRESPRSVQRKSSLEETYHRLEAFDERFRRRGFRLVAGVDEAGRGALAGPVVAAAVMLPPRSGLVGVFDSKRITERRREELFEAIVEKALSVGIAFLGPGFIDEHNILMATLFAMRCAVGRLRPEPDLVLVDGRDPIDSFEPAAAVTGGDGKSLSIAAASIVAKVARDRFMRKLGERFPQYDFAQNKGYGSRIHIESIVRYGMSSAHRKSYRLKAVENTLQIV